jgi:glyoxylase-like metal-dependent hydrolase (beta-lactamase superfamily II)
MNNPLSFSSRHFYLDQLAEGVFAAISRLDGWAIASTGIVDLGDRTLIYDTTMTPASAADLKVAAETLFNRPVHLVINSHYHNDHIWGNQVFDPQADIISTAKTRELILTEGKGEIEWFADITPKRLEELQVQAREAKDKNVLHHLGVVNTYYQAVQSALAGLQPRLPNLTFIGEMTFQGTRRTARLIPYEFGHTGSDAILYLPELSVFMEDLLFIVSSYLMGTPTCFWLFCPKSETGSRNSPWAWTWVIQAHRLMGIIDLNGWLKRHWTGIIG